jgi:eukaryotic-like serine/threonine-protein kinase
MLGVHMSSALGYLHDRGWCHLDVKPGNITVQGTQATLFDFGHAREPGDGHRGAGTREYMSPEQRLGSDAGAAADVFGLGATLWCCATGFAPFSRQRVPRDRVMALRADPVRQHRRLPRVLAELLDASMAPTIEDRPSIDEMSTVCLGCT